MKVGGFSQGEKVEGSENRAEDSLGHSTIHEVNRETDDKRS